MHPYPQPTRGVTVFVVTGVALTAAWMYVCHPSSASAILNQSDGRDLTTLGVLIAAVVIVIAVIGAAWGAILGFLSRLIMLAMLVGFGFGCWLAWQNFQVKHLDSELAVGSAGGITSGQTTLTLPDQMVSTPKVAPKAPTQGLWWQAPLSEKDE